MLGTYDRKIWALALVMIMLLPGCMDRQEDVDDEKVELSEPESVVVPYKSGCDNLNPIHCLLPFPSDAFLIEDNTTVTGLRVNYSKETFPVSGSDAELSLPALNHLDGMSPSSQIITAFSTTPNLTGVADQYTVSLSLQDSHATILLNLDTGERIAHWVENDARTTNENTTLVFIRTMGALEPNTAYGVGISGLDVTPSASFQAVIDGAETNALDVESRRSSMSSLLATLASKGYAKDSLNAAWTFHTASVESTTNTIFSMREDALDRLGDDGIGCTVTSSEDDWEADADNLGFRRIRGTFTAPQYLEWQNPPSKFIRDANGTPQFVENAEIPFTLVIPQILADLNESGPLMVFGHGFLGNGEDTVSGGSLGWAEDFKVSFVATDIYGWSGSDFDTIGLGLFNLSYFQHQSDRLQQMLINQMSMVRTFKGACSDLSEMYNNGTNLVDSSDVNYMGYSLGGIYGASITAISPDLDRAALWVGGSAFSSIIERSTNYASFEEEFSMTRAYPDRNDRALLIAICQQLWDPADPETYLRYANEGNGGEIGNFSFLSIISVNDAQVPMLSSDRAASTAGIPVLSSSARLPYGLSVQDGPINGSAVVYWDGDFPAVPTGNTAADSSLHSLAHNLIAPIPEVNDMVRVFLYTGVVNDTCEETCIFESDSDE